MMVTNKSIKMKITKNTISNVYKSEKRSQFHGYNLVEELFCDSSGFGKDWEIALTSLIYVKRRCRSNTRS